ncbi:MAG: hypothetical protein S4CHLAM102_11890 [Chlamydiia bacterium]|nr:hypothetical protein [Chlamydiia bacterium]
MCVEPSAKLFFQTCPELSWVEGWIDQFPSTRELKAEVLAKRGQLILHTRATHPQNSLIYHIDKIIIVGHHVVEGGKKDRHKTAWHVLLEMCHLLSGETISQANEDARNKKITPQQYSWKLETSEKKQIDRAFVVFCQTFSMDPSIAPTVRDRYNLGYFSTPFRHYLHQQLQGHTRACWHAYNVCADTTHPLNLYSSNPLLSWPYPLHPSTSGDLKAFCSNWIYYYPHLDTPNQVDQLPKLLLDLYTRYRRRTDQPGIDTFKNLQFLLSKEEDLARAHSRHTGLVEGG